MSETYTQCPKCNYMSPKPLLVIEPCPACGVYIFKLKQSSPVFDSLDNHYSHCSTWNGFPLSILLQPLEKMDSTILYCRCFVLFFLVLWSWHLVGYNYRDGEIFGSFAHNILLPIHEAGHIAFIPFGELFIILGGSLFQLALPFGVSIAFVLINRDNFGAGVGLWLTSASMLDLSPYIYDALHPQLILLGGHTGEDGLHDWIYLLTRVGQLHNAQRWGTFVHSFGSILMFIALVWGALILWNQRNLLSKSGSSQK